MKNNYFEPEVERVEFGTNDIMVTSTSDPNDSNYEECEDWE